MNRPQVIRQPWLSILRGVCILLALYNMLPGVLRLPAYYNELAASQPWPNRTGWTQAGFAAAVEKSGLSPQLAAALILIPALVKMVVFFSIGLLIFWRFSNEWLGLLASYVLIGLTGTFTGDRFASLNSLTPFWQFIAYEASVIIWVAFFLFLLLFPDGRFRPGWMRWVGLGFVIWYVLVEVLTYLLGQTPEWLDYIGFGLVFSIVPGQVIRYRYLSTKVARQQMRWFLLAVAIFTIYSILRALIESPMPLPAQPGPFELFLYLADTYLSAITFLLIPISIGIAILRYHLWDIDLIIRRTLQYGVVTFALGLTYAGLVILLGQLFQDATGQQSTLVLVVSTLVIVVLFNPVRQRVQKGVDRRFFRARYDAGQALDRFAAAARSQLEPGALTSLLVQTTQETLEPEGVWVWMRAAQAGGLGARQ